MNKRELIAAMAAVSGGTASQEQLRKVKEAATQAGSLGNDARQALRDAGQG